MLGLVWVCMEAIHAGVGLVLHGSDPCWGWFGSGTETNSQVGAWCNVSSSYIEMLECNMAIEFNPSS